MKHLLYIIVAVATLMAGSQSILAQYEMALVNDADMVLLDSALYLIDSDNPKDALKILDQLHKKYKNNSVIDYERLYAQYQLGNYGLVVKEGKALMKNSNANSQCYQMVGNVQDLMGDRNAALQTYDEGLKRFPNSGFLYLEKGNILASDKKLPEAVECYTHGVEVQPDFDSNYFHLAEIYTMSDNPLWAIFYAEVVCNITSSTERRDIMGKAIYDIYNMNITTDGKDIKLDFVSSQSAAIGRDSTQNQVPIDLSYAMLLYNNLYARKDDFLKSGKLSISQLTDLRERTFQDLDSLGQEGYYNIGLLNYYRQVIKSGHWEAYNMFLMQKGNPDEADQWIKEPGNKEKLTEFLSWFRDNRYVPSQESPTVVSRMFKVDALNIPSLDAVSTVEGCREHRDDALRLAKWYLEQDAQFENNDSQKAVLQFLMKWMESTDEFMFIIPENKAFGNIDIFVAFLAASIEHAIEFKVKTLDEAMYCEVMLQVVDFYKRKRATLGDIPGMTDYAKMDGPTLRETLSKDYRKQMSNNRK